MGENPNFLPWFHEQIDNAKSVSDAYELANPDCKIKFKRPCAAGTNATFKNHWTTIEGGGKCTRCGESDVYRKRQSQGCRMNGDGYGATVAWCRGCGLFDYESYDEY